MPFWRRWKPSGGPDASAKPLGWRSAAVFILVDMAMLVMPVMVIVPMVMIVAVMGMQIEWFAEAAVLVGIAPLFFARHQLLEARKVLLGDQLLKGG